MSKTKRDPKKVANVRKNRRLWKENRKYNEQGYSVIYGWRHRKAQNK